MRRAFVLMLIGMCAGCAGDPAHKDCDRKLVPINVLQTELKAEPAAGSSKQVNARSE